MSRNIIEDLPFTLILTLIGLGIGLFLPSSLGIIGDFDFSDASTDPVGTLTGFVIGGTSAVIIKVISGLVGGLIMGTVGLIIDIFRNSGEHRR